MTKKVEKSSFNLFGIHSITIEDKDSFLGL